MTTNESNRWRCQVCGVKAWEPCISTMHNTEDRCARSCCTERPYGVHKNERTG